MRINTYQKFLLIAAGCVILFWVLLFQSGLKISLWNVLYDAVFGLIPLVGGVIGVLFSLQWITTKNSIGRTVLFISLGLLSWGLGALAWDGASLISLRIPYPSLSDVGFVLAIPLWLLGMSFLPKTITTREEIGVFAKIFVIFVSIIAALISFYLLVIVARHGTISTNGSSLLKLFFDFAYPIGDMIIFSYAIILLGLIVKNYGGQYLLSILILIAGFVFMYVGDFMFTYTTTIGTFYRGNFADLFYTIALSCMTFGVLGFHV